MVPAGAVILLLALTVAASQNMTSESFATDHLCCKIQRVCNQFRDDEKLWDVRLSHQQSICGQSQIVFLNTLVADVSLHVQVPLL